MRELIRAVMDWPPIVQGVIGAAIFWVVQRVGTTTYSFCADSLAQVSNKARVSRLGSEVIRCQAFKAFETGGVEKSGMYAAVLWFRTGRHLLKALIWLTFGLICNSYIRAFGVVGYLGCLYYLFSGFQILRPFDDRTDVSSKLDELERQLREARQAR